MLRIMFFALLALIAVSTIAAIVTVVFFLAMMLAFAVAVGVPVYLIGRHWGRQRGLAQRLNPLERLQHLYVEGKIDLFEYEQRVAALLAVERW